MTHLSPREQARRLMDVEMSLRAGDRDGAIRAAERAVSDLAVNRAAFVQAFARLVEAGESERAVKLLETALGTGTNQWRWLIVIAAVVVFAGAGVGSALLWFASAG